MNRITLHPFDLTTTQIGFGCSSLLGLSSERESRALIDAAYDAGVRHFDVARSYAYGAAEGFLGKTLGSRRANVTITTKFGLPVPKQQALVQAARALARPLVKRLYGLRSRSKAMLGGLASTVAFTAEEAGQSLATSLRELKSDHVDLFLLHEASAAALRDDRLLDFLRQSREEGKIRGYGIGSDRSLLPALIDSKPGYCPVVQHQWSVLTGDPPIPPASSRICHGALLRSLEQIQQSMTDPAVARASHQAVGKDLNDPRQLAGLLLRSAVLQHPASVILFSARSPRRIEENIASLTDSGLDAHCAQLCMFFAHKPHRPH